MKRQRGRKKISVSALCGALILFLAGCGPGPGTQNGGEGAGWHTPVTDQNKDVAADDPVVISMAWWGGQTRHDQTQAVCDLYTSQHPNVRFELLPSGWDGYFDKLATQTASGSMPDIVQMDYQYLSTYARNGSLTDLRTFIEDGTMDVSQIDNRLLQTGEVGGRMVAMVLSTALLNVGYNQDVLAEAGVAEPTATWTWSDFVALCGDVHDRTGKYGISVDPVADTNMFHYWVRQQGGKLFSDDNKSLGYEDDRIFADFVDMWNGLISREAMPDPDAYARIATLGPEAGPVVTGDAAMIFEWNNYASKVSSVNDRIRMITPPLPDSSDAKGLWMKPGMFFAVAETSKVKREAAAFISWFINSREANDIMLAERGVPVSSVICGYLIDSGSLGAQQIAMFEGSISAAAFCGDTPPPDPAGISEVNEAFRRAANSVYYGQTSLEEAAAAFRREADEILESNN